MKWLLILIFTLNLHAEEKKFVVRLTEDPGTLDWTWGETQFEIVQQMMEGLFVADKNGIAEPAVAKEWDWNKKRTEITIKLNSGIKWSDGKGLCAQDFVRAFKRLQDKKFASPYAHYATPLFKNYRAPNCNTLKIATTRFVPEMAELLSHPVFFPLREEHLKKVSAFKDGKNLLVNGPYKISEWKNGQSILLERNTNYVSLEKMPDANPDKIEFLFLPEETSALALYELGKIDWFRDLSPLSRQKKFKESGEFGIFPALIAYYLGLNSTKSKLLEDLNVRHGLQLALGREELPKVLGEEYLPSTTWLPATVLERKLRPVLPEESKIVSKAREVLSKAQEESRMDLKLRVYAKPAHKLMAEWAQGQWEKKLKVKIPIEVVEEKVYWNEIGTNPAPIFLGGITAPFNHPRAFLQEFLSTSTANWLSWKSETYDLAFEDEKYVRAEDVLLAAGVVIPLYTRANAALVKREWQDFFINPLGAVYLKKVHH